jgi:hypothetical protein
MSTGRPPPGTIPTLTEVVAWPDSAEAAQEPATSPAAVPPPAAAVTAVVPEPASAPVPVPAAAVPTTAPVPAAAPAATRSATPTAADVQLTQRVLADLQRQVELMLEVRLREALAPILARASDALVRDARKELTAAISSRARSRASSAAGKTADPVGVEIGDDIGCR